MVRVDADAVFLDIQRSSPNVFRQTSLPWFFVVLGVTSQFFGSSDLYSQESIPNFRHETVDSKVIIGYGIAIGDVNGDGKPDILLADKKQFVWYENPKWTRHVIAENLTERDNVCIAARDIDGDGKVEIAVGGQWNPGDTENSGSVHYLVAPEDRTQKWTPVKLKNEPVVHRMRWVKVAKSKFVLVVAPLHGRGNKGGEGVGAKLLAYHPPVDPSSDQWETTLLDDELHVAHNFEVAQYQDEDAFESIFYLGKEGAKLIQPDGDQWKKQVLKSVQGGGEIRFARTPGQSFLTTIEPFHGTHLVVYSSEANETAKFSSRVVLADNFNQGHAVAVGDLFGNGYQQIVAGWRKPNKEREMGVKLFYRTENSVPNSDSKPNSNLPSIWKSIFIDTAMACEDLRIADLNNDGRLDIIASGRSTHNLKIYWNEGN